MKYRRFKYLVTLVFLGVFFADKLALAETSCSVEPFNIKISQGQSANFLVFLTMDNPSAPYEFSLGGMPNNTEGGFSTAVSIEQGGALKKVPLSIKAKTGAQLGSFMITIISKSAVSGETYQTFCQLNLEITKAVQGGVTENNASKESLSKSIGTGVLPRQVSASSTIILHANPASVTKISNAITSEKKQPTKSVLVPVQSDTESSKITMNLKLGWRGAQVKLLQEILQKNKFFPAEEKPSGYFGPMTEEAVKAFQSANNLEPVGSVGPKTRVLLNY